MMEKYYDAYEEIEEKSIKTGEINGIDLYDYNGDNLSDNLSSKEIKLSKTIYATWLVE